MSGVDIKVDQSIIQPIIEGQIQAAIVQNLGNTKELMEKLVSAVLSRKVDSSGNLSTSSYDAKYDLIDVLVRKGIQDAAKEAINEWIKDNLPKIKETILKEMKKPDRQKTIAFAFLEAVENGFRCNWNVGCNISFKQRD
jgi:hypothetical protein